MLKLCRHHVERCNHFMMLLPPGLVGVICSSEASLSISSHTERSPCLALHRVCHLSFVPIFFLIWHIWVLFCLNSCTILKGHWKTRVRSLHQRLHVSRTCQDLKWISSIFSARSCTHGLLWAHLLFSPLKVSSWLTHHSELSY